MKEDYENEPFTDWVRVHGINFHRKLENETAFDGIVKIYSLRTNSEKINELLKGLYFGELIQPTRNGLILRKFKNINSWPKTSLTHLNIETQELKIILDSNSSYDIWTVTELENDRYEICLTPTEKIEFVNV